MKASDLFVKALENEGVEYIFGIPGEENLDLLESLRKSKVKLVITRHEQAAGFMAATVGRLTGKPGVALSTLGPGATNFVTAAAFAQLGGMPMMMITGQKPVKKSKQGRFQIVDTVHILNSITKFTKQVIHSESIPALVRQAFRQAETERPGAVHLELPEDVAKEEVEESLLSVEKIRRPVAEDKAIDKAVEMIEKAKFPLLVIGAGANRKQTAKMLTEFIEKTGIYFVNTQMGKGVIDERHKQYLGTAALSENDYVHCALDKSDLIINVGHDIVEKPPFIMNHDDPPEVPSAQSSRASKQQVIHINFFEADLDRIYFPQHEVVGDIANAIWQIKEKITKQKWDSDYFIQTKELLEKAIKVDSSLIRYPITPQYFVSEIRNAMPDDGIVSLDNGIYKVWFARHYKTYQPNTLLLDNALATMGAGLPNAIAAKMINPDKKVVAVCGDGGFMMNSQELETAIRLKLNLVVIILNDNAYGMIKWKQQAEGFENFGLDYNNPDFVKYAESYGARGVRIENEKDFASVLKDALGNKGVTVIEVPVDYSENQKVLIDDLKNKKCPV